MPHVRGPRTWLRPSLLALAALAALVTGCGGDSGGGRLLSRQQAGDLRGSLTRLEQDVAAKDCSGAQQELASLESRVDSIRRLDSDLRRALRSSTRRLGTLLDSACQTSTTTPETTTTTPTPDTGTTGATGATGPQDQGGKPKKPKDKPKKDKLPPGQGGEVPPGQQGGGGGAGIPGETNSGGGGN